MPKKKFLTLTNAEHRIMEVIWARGSATVAEVVANCANRTLQSLELSLTSERGEKVWVDCQFDLQYAQ